MLLIFWPSVLFFGSVSVLLCDSGQLRTVSSSFLLFSPKEWCTNALPSWCLKVVALLSSRVRLSNPTNSLFYKAMLSKSQPRNLSQPYESTTQEKTSHSFSRINKKTIKKCSPSPHILPSLRFASFQRSNEPARWPPAPLYPRSRCQPCGSLRPPSIISGRCGNPPPPKKKKKTEKTKRCLILFFPKYNLGGLCRG